MIASHNVIRLEGCLFSTTQDRALRRAHVLHLGRWIQNCADRVAALLQHWCVPLEDRPHLQSGVETLASRTCRPPPIGHTAVRTKTAGSYWTSTQQTMNPGGPLGHQNRRHTWHMPLPVCESPSPERSEDAVLNSPLLLRPVPLSPDRKHENRIGNERKFSRYGEPKREKRKGGRGREGLF